MTPTDDDRLGVAFNTVYRHQNLNTTATVHVYVWVDKETRNDQAAEKAGRRRFRGIDSDDTKHEAAGKAGKDKSRLTIYSCRQSKRQEKVALELRRLEICGSWSVRRRWRALASNERQKRAVQIRNVKRIWYKRDGKLGSRKEGESSSIFWTTSARKCRATTKGESSSIFWTASASKCRATKNQTREADLLEGVGKQVPSNNKEAREADLLEGVGKQVPSNSEEASEAVFWKASASKCRATRRRRVKQFSGERRQASAEQQQGGE
ncbi:uncharacterized protein LOC121404931 [Drosophila obscura]|uniref:uncharacterized protein LOC121404931 n=1 Tax=Drosophila obscura TaxID=7282 RepID=UPI001BB16B10|nr:uncharacterized protein LOC121404931 [Drosophila obscura]